jgi:hypothetical protein
VPYHFAWAHSGRQHAKVHSATDESDERIAFPKCRALPIVPPVYVPAYRAKGHEACARCRELRKKAV